MRLSGGEATQPLGRLSKVQFKSLVASNLAGARDAAAAASAAHAAANATGAAYADLEAARLPGPGSPARSLPRPSTAPATR